MVGAARPRGWIEALARRFELSRGGAGHNVRPMEGLRGLAVFLVFLVHYVTLVMPWVPEGSVLMTVAHRLHAMGNVGVDLFFVLSGYLIYGTLVSRRQRYRDFIWRRVVRIYPAFLAVFVLYLGLSLVFPAESKIPSGTVPALAYLGANLLLLPGLAPITPMITVAWSLSYEFFYYLVMPGVVWVLALRARSPRWRLGFFTGAAALGLLVFGSLGGPIRLWMFVPGILLHEWLQLRPDSRRRSGIGLGALLAALVLAGLSSQGGLQQILKLAAIGLLFMVVCHASFTDPAGWLARGLSFTPLRWLGNASYSYYLIHGLALKALFMVAASWWPGAEGAMPGMFWLCLPLAFAVSCGPALVLFLAIERPYSLAPGRAARAAAV